jgi:hypothetical protein
MQSDDSAARAVGWVEQPAKPSQRAHKMGFRFAQPILQGCCVESSEGPNLPEDAIYPINLADETGKPLDGANRYVLHFEGSAGDESRDVAIGAIRSRAAPGGWLRKGLPREDHRHNRRPTAANGRPHPSPSLGSGRTDEFVFHFNRPAPAMPPSAPFSASAPATHPSATKC